MGRSRWAGAFCTAASSGMAAEPEAQVLPASDPTAAALLKAYATELAEQGIGRPVDRVQTISSEYEDPHGTFVVLYAEGEPVACGGIRPLPDDGVAEVKRMYVAPHARGQGLGRRLLARLEDEARKRGYKRVRLDTAAPLSAAQSLYRRAGYREIDDYNGNGAA